MKDDDENIRIHYDFRSGIRKTEYVYRSYNKSERCRGCCSKKRIGNLPERKKDDESEHTERPAPELSLRDGASKRRRRRERDKKFIHVFMDH